jgi:hypothetical protein
MYCFVEEDRNDRRIPSGLDVLVVAITDLELQGNISVAGSWWLDCCDLGRTQACTHETFNTKIIESISHEWLQHLLKTIIPIVVLLGVTRRTAKM